MKNIYTIYEGLLDDVEKTLSDMDSGAFAKMYPVPKVKDFGRWAGKLTLHWNCPELIQQYIHELIHPDLRFFHGGKDIIGIEFCISDDKHISTYLYDECHEWLELYGVGGWVSNKLPDAKRAVLDCIKKILDNPDNISKMLKLSNKHKEEADRIGMYDCVPYNEIF